uniref:RING-type domain-containing protein n=1 Tax=Cacopsylla melanoneura TaxID=428564 RepID=A0A8D8ZET3_9HEMI
MENQITSIDIVDEKTDMMDCEGDENYDRQAVLDLTCKLCSKIAQDVVSVICGHWFCSKCLDRYFRLVQRLPKVCPLCEYAITDEEKQLSFMDRELEMSSAQRFYKAWTYKYQMYSDFPQGEFDNWSTVMNDEDNLSDIDDADLIPDS